MKKISFGSFPLNDIRKDDRKCLDRYLIKTFSDNIAISDAMRNLAVTKNLMYITPDVLMQNWMRISKENTSLENKKDRTSNSTYDAALKRAFYILKEFYKKIQHAPFYKENVYYPIYVEKIDSVQVLPSKDASDNSKHTEIQMNYSFVILSNDLTKNLKIDEITYDDNASLNFLFLFIEFFSGSDFQKSIHDFDEDDYQFLIRMYQFIEESGKDPIHMVLDLYKLLGLIKEANGGKSSRMTMSSKINPLSDSFEAGNLTKYKGLIRHNIFDILKKRPGSVPAKSHQQAFRDIMEIIFKSEGLSGLYKGVETGADLGERYRYVYSSNKYREILNVAKELVEYNKLVCTDVVKEDPMDFDFKVERGKVSIDMKSHIVGQRYQTFFKTYVESISTYLQGFIQTIISSLNIDTEINQTMAKLKGQWIKQIEDAESTIEDLNSKMAVFDSQIESSSNYANAAASAGDNTSYNRHVAERRAAQAGKDNNTTEMRNLIQAIKDYDILNNINRAEASRIQSTISKVGDTIYDSIKDKVLASIATDLTFIFDDGKRFFSNPLITEGFMDSIGDASYDMTSKDGFEKTANDSFSTSVFPVTIPADGKGKIPNPSYYSAQVAKSLQDSFDVMADDTIVAISDQIIPSIQSLIIKEGLELSPINQPNSDKKWERGIQYTVMANLMEKFKSSALPDDLKKTLSKDIYRDRFISNILRNFSKLFTVNHIDSIVAFDDSVSELHPLIRKMIKSGDKCQFFKSFILNFDTAEQLYNTKYVLDTQKFLHGLIDEPPRKLSNASNRIQEVLFKYLGLKNNPVWLLSKTEVYLSMPDDLSLTNTSILSKIPKTELMDVCKIKASDYWNENSMNKVANFGNGKSGKAASNLKSATNELKDLNRRFKDAKGSQKDRIEKDIEKANKKIDRAEEELAKAKLDDKNYTPNAFVFAEEDPNKAENTELLTQAERDDINKRKEDMQNELSKFNKYDQDEVDAMEKIVEDQTSRKNPFELDEPYESKGSEEIARESVAEKESAIDEFMRKRQEHSDK